MKEKRYFIALFCLLIVCLVQCKKTTEQQPPARSFYMGTTPWPPDFTEADVNRAYAFINNECDIVSHHFDDGIPYEQAWQNLPMPLKLSNEVATRKAKTATGKKVFLSISALTIERNQKALLLQDVTDSIIQNYWKNLPFNDPKVVMAYINYVSYLVDEFQPVYVNFGVESNASTWETTGNFVQYKDFLRQVYPQLKSKFPAIPFFISFITGDDNRLVNYAAQLTDYTDMIGLSAYPYIGGQYTADGRTDPARLNESFFTTFTNLAPNKPFGFAETGYAARDLVIPSFSLNKQCSVQWQNDYLNKILKFTNDHNGKFLIWFCSYDYTAGINTIISMGLYQDLFRLWETTGFYDSNLIARPALATWQQWILRRKS